MITGKTQTGFEFSIDERRLKNYELVEALAELENNPLLLTKIVKLLLGDDAEKLKDHVRDDSGFVDTEKMNVEIADIFNIVKELKK